MATIFTKIIKGDIPSYKIYEDSQFYAFLDISPLTKGHTLLIPKEEVDYIFDVGDTTLSEMILVAKKIAHAIEKAIDCNRVGLMVIGLEVPHAHIHLIPIHNEGDMDLSNDRVELSKDQFERIAKDINSYL